MGQLPKSFTKRNGRPHIPYREWVIVNTSHKPSKVKNELQLKNEKVRVCLQWLLNHKINLACLLRSMLTFPETGDDEEYATPSRVAGQWVELRNWSSGQWFGESVFWTNLFNDLFQVKKESVLYTGLQTSKTTCEAGPFRKNRFAHRYSVLRLTLRLFKCSRVAEKDKWGVGIISVCLTPSKPNSHPMHTAITTTTMVPYS